MSHGAVSRSQTIGLGHRFEPTLRLIMLLLGFLGLCSRGSAFSPSCANAESKDAAAFRVCSSASGCVQTMMPTIPPSIIPLDPSSEYDHSASWSAAWMRLAIPSDSLESQYAVTLYAWPLKTLSFPAMDLTCTSVNCRSARAAVSRAVSLSALAARSFASAICNRNCSAFLRATSAASRALAARAFSWAACRSAWAARSYVAADCFRESSASLRAAAASRFACATSVSAICCSRSETWDSLLPKMYSPTTPPRTSTPHRMLIANSRLLRLASFSNMKWATYSPRMPIATATVDKPIHQLYEESSCSRAFLSIVYAPYSRKRFFDTVMGALLALAAALQLIFSRKGRLGTHSIRKGSVY